MRLFFVGGVMLAMAAVAHAQAIYSASSRSLHAEANIGAPSDLSFAATGGWNQTIDFYGSSNLVHVVARQNSDLAPDFINLSASTTASRQNGTSGMGRNTLTATFALTSETPFSLTGSFTPSSNHSPSEHLRLTGPSGDVFNILQFNNAISLSGTLPAGSYTLDYLGMAFASTGAFNENSYCNVTLAIPAPGSVGLLASALLLATRRRR